MDRLLLPLLIATAVALLIWGVSRLITDESRGERKRLSRRLSTEGQIGSSHAGDFKPITLQLDVAGVPLWLAERPFIQALNRRLLQAYPQATMGRFLAMVATSAFSLLVLAFAFTGVPLIAMGAGLLGLYIPFFVLGRRRAKRQRMIAEQLPEALDFLSRVLRAGHSFSTGLQMMADELPRPLSDELRRCYDQHSLGQALEDSLKETAARIDSTDFAFFVTSLLISRQTGGDLSEVLSNISGMIRGRVRLAQQVKSKTAEGRFTGYILVAFPAVMFLLCYVQSPENASKLLHGSGLYFLGAAFTLQMIGLWAIRRITAIKV